VLIQLAKSKLAFKKAVLEEALKWVMILAIIQTSQARDFQAVRESMWITTVWQLELENTVLVWIIVRLAA